MIKKLPSFCKSYNSLTFQTLQWCRNLQIYRWMFHLRIFLTLMDLRDSFYVSLHIESEKWNTWVSRICLLCIQRQHQLLIRVLRKPPYKPLHKQKISSMIAQSRLVENHARLVESQSRESVLVHFSHCSCSFFLFTKTSAKATHPWVLIDIISSQ